MVNNKLNLKFFIMFILIIGVISSANAALVFDRVQFDPAIISSGDEVDVIILFHDNTLATDSNHIGNSDYDYRVTLFPDDTVTRDYVLIQDAEGDDLYGKIFGGEYYNKKFKVKISQDAPPGTYQFKLVGQWYYKGKAENAYQESKFNMDVKKTGISLEISNIISNPDKIRSGDKNVLLTTTLFNSGEKLAKNVDIQLIYPEGISASYTNNNNLNLGVINSMQNQNIQFYIDTEKTLKSGLYSINYTLTYQDVDSNEYVKHDAFPLVIKKKPYIKVIESTTSGVAGDEAELKVVVQNIGEEKADAVDVRIIKQSSQPFEMDVRSSYLGELKPGENATAIFKIAINSDAEIKSHNLNLAIRAKGDSEEGDNNVYSYSDSAKIEVTGKIENNYPFYALVFGIIVLAFVIIYYTTKSRK